MVLVLNKNPRAWYFYKQKKRITHHGFPLSLLNKKSTLYGLMNKIYGQQFQLGPYEKINSNKNCFITQIGTSETIRQFDRK